MEREAFNTTQKILNEDGTYSTVRRKVTDDTTNLSCVLGGIIKGDTEAFTTSDQT